MTGDAMGSIGGDAMGCRDGASTGATGAVGMGSLQVPHEYPSTRVEPMIHISSHNPSRSTRENVNPKPCKHGMVVSSGQVTLQVPH